MDKGRKTTYTTVGKTGEVVTVKRRRVRRTNTKVKTGLTLGSVLAIIISYTAWGSIGWAIFHGLLGWAYVIYFILVYKL